MPPEEHPSEGVIPDARYAAGLDVHKYHVTACVATRQGRGETISQVALQEFKTDPRGLGTMARFLAKYPLQTVAMEDTGIYSAPVKEALDRFEGWSCCPRVLTFNPTEVKHFPGEIHEDKADAFSIARLALLGLLRGSFIPDGPIRELRELTREAGTLTTDCTRAKSRIKRVLAAWGLALPRLNLDKAWSLDLFHALDWAEGDFGKALGGMRSGEFPVPVATSRALASREADYAPFSSVVIPPAAHVVLRGYILSLAAGETLIARLGAEVEDIVANNPAIEAVAQQIATIDGITAFTAASIIGEVGDIGRFTTVKQFLAYSGCAPTLHQSGTKLVHGRLTKRANAFLKRKFYLAGMLISTTVKRNSELKAYANAQRQRHPSKLQNKLVWANTGAKVARVVFALLRTSRSYDPSYSANHEDLASAGNPEEQCQEKPAKFSLRDLRNRTRQFVKYLNRFQADAPAKFQAVAEAFEKISWA